MTTSQACGLPLGDRDPARAKARPLSGATPGRHTRLSKSNEALGRQQTVSMGYSAAYPRSTNPASEFPAISYHNPPCPRQLYH